MPPPRVSCTSGCAPRGAEGRSFAFVAMQKFPRLMRQLEEARVQDSALELRVFDDLDAALEWTEGRLLDATHDSAIATEIALSGHELARGLSPDEMGSARAGASSDASIRRAS
jgi:hypothetical protein